MKLKRFIKNHKALLCGVVIVAGVAYLVLRKGKSLPTSNELAIFRHLLPGEDALEVAKSMMGPDVVVETTKTWWAPIISYVIPGKDHIVGMLL